MDMLDGRAPLPLQLLTAFQSSNENAVALLTGYIGPAISAQRLENLAELIDERKCDGVALY